MTEKLYKVLDGDKSCNGGTYTWSLPVKNADGTWTPGEWTKPVEGPLELCENGYHICRERDLIFWLGCDIYEVEAVGSERVEDNEGGNTKIAVRSCRLVRKIETWNDRTARLFAVWCAREALKLIDSPDPRSIAACDVAEKFANGEATEEELAAVRATAWAAAWDAVRDAVRATAWVAAWATAWVAAWDAQTKKLFEMLGE